MSHSSKIFSKVPIKVQNRSGFDKSHENLFTAPVGTLVPALCEEMLPNSSISLGVFANVQLPPMATDFYGRVDAKFEAFFVPSRLLYGGWQAFMTHPVNGDYYPGGSTPAQRAKYLPYVVGSTTGDLVAGSLADYLGLKVKPLQGANIPIKNVLPFVAYHKIWDDWYRDSRIQQPIFQFGNDPTNISMFPTSTDYSTSPIQITTKTFADNFSLFSLRQRNFARDYFTNATLMPQAGQPATLKFAVSTNNGQDPVLIVANGDNGFNKSFTSPTFDGDYTVDENMSDGLQLNGSFTIASLRAANSLQKWLERNNLAGYRYADQIKAQFGIYPSDATIDRAIYLGSHTINVYNKSVNSTSTPDSDTANNLKNPFADPATTGIFNYGKSQAVGDGSLIDKFTTTEHGYIMVMFSLVPHAYYATGTRRYLNRQNVGDFAFPLLAGVGDQEITNSELLDSPSSTTFGYTQRYAEYKYHDDEVHGLLRDGQSLESFCLKRSFSTAPSLSSQFLRIPTDFLDDVAAVSSGVSNFGCWVDTYFTQKEVLPLPAYSIPTLGDESDTHTEVIPNGGRRL